MKRVSMKIMVCCMTAVVAVTLPAVGSTLRPDITSWETDCSTIEGWHGNGSDPNMGAAISQYEPSVIEIRQEGSSTWGKVAYRVGGVDVEETPILEVKVNKVDQDSAFKVAIAPADWSELLVVIDRTSAHGVHRGDIKKAIEKSGRPESWVDSSTFNVVVVVEGKGKSTYVDHVRIRSKN